MLIYKKNNNFIRSFKANPRNYRYLINGVSGPNNKKESSIE
jgi:hypothetical protein